MGVLLKKLKNERNLLLNTRRRKNNCQLAKIWKFVNERRPMFRNPFIQRKTKNNAFALFPGFTVWKRSAVDMNVKIYKVH
jgi:hypothetical protein